ncbi:hypothetical protein KSP40_PGU007446 [Platanthera guangdongensis]|uniref:Hcy-binding domain-containing protein n=1 Tax=Platanthera guangdongensis TaxID=2320717 RepID=A0ABR2MKN1_9ASPA
MALILLIFEIISNIIEAQAYVELLKETNIRVRVWFSYNGKDEYDVVSGDSSVDCASVTNAFENVIAIGINSTFSRDIHGLILYI